MERRAELRQLTNAEVQEVVTEVLPGAWVHRVELIRTGRANTNYIVDLKDVCCVLRVHRQRELGEKEQALLTTLGDVPVPVPRLLGRGALPAAPHAAYSLLEFVPGRRLEELLIRGDAVTIARAGQTLGRALAALVAVRFEAFGDLRSDGHGGLAVTPWPFSDYFAHCLFDTPAGGRLGPLRDEMWALLSEHAYEFTDPLPIHLVHGDLNLGNVLVHAEGTVSALLDWEFAHAGKLWSDLGNLLRERAECPLPTEFAVAVAAGLHAGGVQLPPNWRKLSLFTDLTSACEFLSSADDRPITHASAIAQIRATLTALRVS